MLYPYFSTAVGLAEWFADKVENINPQTMLFHWELLWAWRSGLPIK